MKLLNKKAQKGIEGLQGFIIGIAGVTIVLSIVMIVLAELRTATDDPNASQAISTVIVKLATIPTWIGIVIVVGLAFIVLGFFYMKGQGQSY